MKKRWLLMAGAVLIPAVGLTVLLLLTAQSAADVLRSASVSAAPAAAPTVTVVDPTSAPNDLNTPVTITGTGLISVPAVYLNGISLQDISWVSGTSLTATVPWGLDPGVYTVTVINPGGASGSLPNAFTVTQGIGVWTTGGPYGYGGEMVELVLHPVTPTTVYALVLNSGVFASHDAGEHWESILFNTGPVHLSIDPHVPTVMYLGTGTYFGLYRTQDGGSTWENVAPPNLLDNTFLYPVVHPSISGVVFTAASAASNRPPEPDEPVGVYRSTDYGTTWMTMTTGLTDTHVTALAFYPDDPSGMKMVAGTRNGNVFTTDDGGQSWHWAAQLAPCIGRLYINPSQPQHVWAVQTWACRNLPPGLNLFRNLDPGLTRWAPITVTSSLYEVVSSLAFDASGNPGTIWASTTNGRQGGYTSTDGGDTWMPVETCPPQAVALAVDPVDQQIVYAGTRCGRFGQRTVCGVYRSDNRGATWSQKNQGLAGLLVEAMAVSPASPDKVYAYTALGLLRSSNGGRAWQTMDVFTYGPSWWTNNLLAVDPFTPTRLYLGGSCGQPPWGLPCVQVGDEDGHGWHAITLTVPTTPTGWGGEVFAVAPHPSRPGRVLAGVTFYPPGFDGTTPSLPLGGIFASDDSGETWEQISLTQPISGVVLLAYDPVDPNLVYAASDGTGVLKSTDAGTTWHSIVSWPADCDCTKSYWLSTHPFVSNIVYAECNRCALRSSNAGVSWPDRIPLPFRGFTLFAPSEPATLYAGDRWGNGGLRRSVDEGQTWEQVTGLPANAFVTALAAGRDAQRVAVYVASSGGIYRQVTRLPTQRIYLPLVFRG